MAEVSVYNGLNVIDRQSLNKKGNPASGIVKQEKGRFNYLTYEYIVNNKPNYLRLRQAMLKIL